MSTAEVPRALQEHAAAIAEIDREMAAADTRKQKLTRAERLELLNAAAQREADRAAQIQRLWAEECATIEEAHAEMVEAERAYTEAKNRRCDAHARLKSIRSNAFEKRSLDHEGRDYGLIHEAVELPPPPSVIWSVNNEDRQTRDAFVAAFNRPEL